VGIPRCASWTVLVQSRHVDEDPSRFLRPGHALSLGRYVKLDVRDRSATIRARDGNRNQAANTRKQRGKLASSGRSSCVHRLLSSLFNDSRAITRLALFCHPSISCLAAVEFSPSTLNLWPIFAVDPSRNASFTSSVFVHPRVSLSHLCICRVFFCSSRHVSSSRLRPFIPALAAKLFESRG